MTGIGLIIAFLGYAIIYWGVNSLSMGSQKPFMHYVFPWGK